MKIDLQKILNSGNDDSVLFNYKGRAVKNHRLMQWAKAATFGLYAVAIFMLYVSDLWGIASFIAKNSNDFIALAVFSVIAFTLSYFLASSKEATYEDIAIHRSEGWKLTGAQVLAMCLFASSGVLFEMFSTTGNQQHIANSAAESSSMMKSIQQTDVSVLGSSGLTDKLQQANMRLAECRVKEAKMKAQGREYNCDQSEANIAAVRESMAMSNQLAQDASEQAFNNKVESMLKVRDSFDKPMFQAMAKYTGTDNNTGMVLVIAVLITIFELQHIMALFAYSNALRRIKQSGNGKPAGNGYNPVFTPSPAPSAGTSPLQAMKQEFSNMVESAPAVIANEYGMAQHARQQVYRKAADKLDSIQGDLNQAKADKTYRAELREGEKAYSDTPLDKPRPALPVNQQPGGTGFQNPVLGTAEEHYELPIGEPVKPQRLSVADTVKKIQRDVKASGATSPEAIQAAVFDAFAAMPHPAPLGDNVLNSIADKLYKKQADKGAQTTPETAPEQSAETTPQTTPRTTKRGSLETTPQLPKGAVSTLEEGGEKTDSSGLFEAWRDAVLAGLKPSSGKFYQFARDHGSFAGIANRELDVMWNGFGERGVAEGWLIVNPDYKQGSTSPKFKLNADIKQAA